MVYTLHRVKYPYIDTMSSNRSETREKILQAAWRLLEAGKAADVRMSDIAKSAGVSRQAVYLHFPARADLLVATARHIDKVKDVDARLAASRSAQGGGERLDAYIEAWGNYIPHIYGVARAFLAMQDSDEAAAAAWRDRMQAMRHGCEAAVKALKADGALAAEYSVKQATDILWTLLSIRNWEHLTQDCGWPQRRYIDFMKQLALRALSSGPTG